MKPNVYYFNPTCELAVVNGSPSFTASAQLRRFENDLCTLPGILAQPDDFVLTDCLIAQKFTDRLDGAGFRLPSFLTKDSAFKDPAFLTLEKGFLFPWGWSPAVHKMFAPLKSACSPEFLASPVAEWNKMHRELYSRNTSLAILQSILESNKSINVLDLNDLPEICTDHEQIINLQSKWRKIVVKAPWSSSGRGLHILRPHEYNQTNKQVISGFLKQQGYIIAGPWHDKILDLSFQFFSRGNGELDYRGLTSFSTDISGHYTGNLLQELPSDLSTGLKVFLYENLPEVRSALHKTLLASTYSTDYYGWLGVDLLVFGCEKGKFKIHPCLEINCRFTMGAIALSLRDHLAPESTGIFRIMQAEKGNFSQFCGQMTKKEPLIIEAGKIVKGFLAVTPTLPDCSSGAWISVKNERMKE